MYELSQQFYFDAAHTLNREIEAQGSRRIHGHTYHAEVTVRGEPDPVSGMVVDIGYFKKEVERARATLDHQLLDDVPGLGPATIENLCAFIYRQLKDALPGIAKVTVERRASGDRCAFYVEGRG
jgi:6-pyruvoyltetrahydropterin/6-carboxytetrahydropterin synthase